MCVCPKKKKKQLIEHIFVTTCTSILPHCIPYYSII